MTKWTKKHDAEFDRLTAKPAAETAAQAHARLLTEAKRRLALIEAALNAKTSDDFVHWGHVGDLSEVVSNLKQVGHWAGVAELTEK